MKTVSPGVAARIGSLPARMSHVVAPWASRAPEAPALVEGARVLSYRQLDHSIVTAGRWLVDNGVRPGDRVMLVGENSIALAVLVLAVGDVDAWPLVVNARISAREVDAIRAHSDTRLIVLTSAASPEASKHGERLGARLQDIPGVGQVQIGALSTAASPEPVEWDGGRQVGALIYTSGTTGAPKGVMLSHRSVLFTAAVGGEMRNLAPDDRVYGVLPMSHIVGFSSVLVASLMFGSCLELVPRFDATGALDALASGRITRFQGVPTMYQRLLEAANGKVVCPHLKSIGVAGAPLDPSLKTQVEAAFGLPLHNGYGITECAPTISFTRVEAPCADTTVGPPIPGIEVRLTGRDGAAVAPGAVGELHVRGPNVMLGYYKAPDLTAAAIDREGWFNTGDLARMEGANLYIVGRTKELIIRSGFNVYPPEVEAVIARHPAVASCAVVGRSVRGNEEVIAFVQLHPGQRATSQEIVDFAAGELAPYKRPAAVLIKEALPTTSAGKIIKHELAKEASELSQ